jgi:predicted enzyme related to lactoylglutathione lyase
VNDQNAGIQYVFAALHVSNRDAALPWYERLFGRAPKVLPTDTEAVWQLAETASVYILADGTRVGGGDVSFVVADLDGQRAALDARGIATEPIVVIDGAGRKSRVLDPDGNAVWFIELPG